MRCKTIVQSDKTSTVPSMRHTTTHPPPKNKTNKQTNNNNNNKTCKIIQTSLYKRARSLSLSSPDTPPPSLSLSISFCVYVCEKIYSQTVCVCVCVCVCVWERERERERERESERGVGDLSLSLQWNVAKNGSRFTELAELEVALLHSLNWKSLKWDVTMYYDGHWRQRYRRTEETDELDIR